MEVTRFGGNGGISSGKISATYRPRRTSYVAWQSEEQMHVNAAAGFALAQAVAPGMIAKKYSAIKSSMNGRLMMPGRC